MTMKCILVKEVGSFTIAEVPVSEPGSGEVLIRVDVAGLCRTDLKLIRWDTVTWCCRESRQKRSWAP